MKKLIIALALTVALSLPILSFAHPGRTNAQGCHNNRKTGDYHCHNSGSAKAPAKVAAPAPSKPPKAATTTAKAVPTEYLATVIRVSDGDTIVIRTADYEDIKIRLYGIDAPESGQDGGDVATAFLAPLQGQTVKIIEMATDRYSRTVALVEHNGQSVNLALVAEGHAWHYPQYCKAQGVCPKIEAAETKAREDKRGLWQDKEPVPPWEWREK